MNFSGAHTALVTPFTAGAEAVDEDALRQLVDHQIEAGIAGILAVGTTGETPTLSNEEHLRVIEVCIEQAAGRVPIIAGCGSNATSEAVALTRQATELGADAILSVSPYYNKPSARGLMAHFGAVAEATDRPIMLYDIPGRTGVKIGTETTVAVAKAHPNILATKVATGEVSDVAELAAARERGELSAGFALLSGDDGMTIEFMRAGACGIVSVASNPFPAEVAAMVRAELDGDRARADELAGHLDALFSGMLSLDTNPVPVKAAMEILGLCRGDLRLPMVPLTDEQRHELEQIIAPIQTGAASWR